MEDETITELSLKPTNGRNLVSLTFYSQLIPQLSHPIIFGKVEMQLLHYSDDILFTAETIASSDHISFKSHFEINIFKFHVHFN